EVAGYCRCTTTNLFGGRDGFSLQTADGPELVQGAIVTPDLPRVLRVSPVLGPGFSEESDAGEVLIGETLWRERLGGMPDVIGHPIELDEETVTIVGVMPDGFNVPGQTDGQVWWKGQPDDPTRRGPFYINAVARLAAGIGAPQAAERLTASVAPELRARFGVDDGGQRGDLSRSPDWRYSLRPMKDVLVGDVRPTLLLTFGAAALVLLIAIMNVTNLLLARGTARVRELAVRAAVGAGRGRLVRQLLAESALLGLFGGVLGLAVAIVLLRLAGDAAVQIVPRMEEVRLNGLMVTLALAAGCVAGIAAGTFPAPRLPQNLVDRLRDAGRIAGGGRQQGRTRRALVVAEVALTLTVVSSAALLVKTLLRLEATHPGFDAQNVLSFRLSLPGTRYAFDDEARTVAFLGDLEARLRALPGVSAVAFSGAVPPDRLGYSNDYTIEGSVPGSAGASDVAEWIEASPDYFLALGIPIETGRVFTGDDRAGAPRVIVVNRSFADRHFPDGNAVGKRIKGGPWDAEGDWLHIIGVVGDVPYDAGVWGGSNETVYIAYAQNLWQRSFYVLVRTASDAARLMPAVRQAVAAVDSRVPLRDVALMPARLHASAAEPRFRSLLFSVLAAVALALAVTGIYGVMAYHVNQHRRDTAIRRALGARTPKVIGSVVGTGLRLAAIGIVIGLAGAIALMRGLSSLLFQVSPADPQVLFLAAGVLLAAAIASCALPATRAARVDPMTVLREE
ncbi:MAG: ADOP family duplicated permease, partial [Longimicrobiales bacterium]